MGGLAQRMWKTGDGPRWDDAMRAKDPAAALTMAREAAGNLRLQVGGFEHSLMERAPRTRTRLRSDYAPWYYDLHRAERLTRAPQRAFPAALAQHSDTRDLAAAMTVDRPPSLAAALARYDERFDARDIEREYFMFTHSLLPSSLASVDAGVPGVFAERKNGGDLLNLDETLSYVYGDHMRSPTLARFAFADVPSHTLLRGTTTDEGHMVLGVMPGSTDGVRDDNRKVPVEEGAHSLLARHYAPERERFNTYMGGGDHSDQLAMALAHGVFDTPTIDPESGIAPTDDAVNYASRLFGREPAYDPGRFRSA